MEPLLFVYIDAKGHTTKRALSSWRESDDYVRGVQLTDDGYRTFRKQQIQSYFPDERSYRASEYPEPPPSAPKWQKDKTDTAPKIEVCFTGFGSGRRRELENLASENDFIVRTRVTKNLNYLCTGPTAGPKKIAAALAMNVVLMDETAFLWMLDTGEIPV